jgi:internalin A
MSYDEAVRRIERARAEKATELDLSGLDLETVPERLGEMTSLRELYLYNNQLTSVPERLGELTALQRLRLDNNQLTSVPERLGELTALRELWLNDNQLTSVPEWLGGLTALQELRLSVNQLTSVPGRLGKLTALQLLDLSVNQLTSVPESLGQLTALQILDLSVNQLTSVPESLGQLTALEVLWLNNNQLMSVPDSLGQLTKLTEFFLHENSGLGIPPEILGPTWREVGGNVSPANPREILEYYFRIRDGARSLNEAKLILVGGGRVGKTSLVKKLRTGEFNPNEPETEGIEIEKWGIPVCFEESVNTQEDVHLHIWDFGGQEFVHATHRFFLTGRSLYLLVLNGRVGGVEGEAEYWLELIQSAGEHSRVLVVLNKNVEHPFDVDRGLLEEKFSIISGFIKTDCNTGLGIEELKKAIAKETAKLEGVHSAFPASWFRLKDRVSGMSDPFLTFEGFQRLCSEYKIEEGDQDSLADALNALGIALNFRKDRFLKDAHVLNPRWVTGGVYAVLYSKLAREAAGVITLDELDQILDRTEYPERMHGFLMRLMQKFELCFQLSPDRFLLPDLLNESQPDDVSEFKPEECLNFEYKYSLLPNGLIPRFIVRTHEMSDGEPRWRTGVVLKYGDCKALVRADVQGRKIVVRILGKENKRRYLLEIIRSHFLAIHQAVKLKAEEMVPLPSHPNFAVSYEKLIGFEEAGIPSFHEFVEGKPILVDVKQLLDGVGRMESEALRPVMIETINELLEAQFNTLIALLPGNPAKWFAGQQASPAERAADLVKWATAPGGCGLEELARNLDDLIGKSWRDPRRRF